MRFEHAPFSAALLFALVGACSSESDDDAPASFVPPTYATPDAASDARASDSGSAGLTTPNHVAGSRLAPLFWRLDGADGSTHLRFDRWQDTLRDETCIFQPMADGQLHCAPWGELPYGGRDVTFEDASCSKSVLVFVNDLEPISDCVEPRAPSKRYVRLRNDRCGVTRLAPFPTQRLALTTVYVRDTEGTCSATQLPSESEVFASPAPLEEVAASAFVAASVTDETTGSARLRVSRKVRTGEDGSREIAEPRVVDTSRNDFCRRQADESGTMRCIPDGEWLSTYGYADATCTTDAWSVANSNQCDKDSRSTYPRYMRTQTECGRVALYPRPTAFTSTVYHHQGAGCEATSVPSDGSGGYSYFTGSLPPAIPSSSFVALGETMRDAPAGYYGKSGSRLHVSQNAWTGTDGSDAALYDRLYDPELEDTCWPRMLGDGKIHCIGNFASFDYDERTKLFADAACTEPAVGISKYRTACTDRPPPRYYISFPATRGTCYTYGLYALGSAAPLATAYERRSSGACGVASQTSYANVYRLGDLTSVPPETFVELSSSLVK